MGSAAEAVEGSALPLESVDNVDGRDRLSFGVLGVGDSVADDVLQEVVEDVSGFIVDEGADSLDSASPGQPPYRRLGDALDDLLCLLALILVPLGPGHARRFSLLASVSCWCHR